MENKAKKKILIIVGIILASIACLTIILSSMINNDPGNTPNKNESMKKEITLLENEATFFNIEKSINDYYYLLTNSKNNDLYTILEKDYIIENNITIDNILEKIENKYSSTSYKAKEIYYNKDSVVTYYFINGYFIDTSMSEDDFKYYENVNYLVIVSENNNYVIRPLSNNINIEEYAKSYSLDYIEINNNFKISSANISEKNKLTIYINEFLNLLFLDTNKAYNMLDENTKNNYNNYNDFKSKINDIYSKLSSVVFSYSVKKIGNINEYDIIDNKQNKIKITEYNTMNYKIYF